MWSTAFISLNIFDLFLLNFYRAMRHCRSLILVAICLCVSLTQSAVSVCACVFVQILVSIFRSASAPWDNIENFDDDNFVLTQIDLNYL